MLPRGAYIREEWTMQSSLLSRRQTLALGAAGGAALLSAEAQSAVKLTPTLPIPLSKACVLTPELEEGPFYFDTKLRRSDIREGHKGVPLRLQLQVADVAGCAPLAGARVDIWHCDARGFYSGEEGQGDEGTTSTVGQTFLRGIQLTDSSGLVTFDTIYPGWYHGRTTHIHLKVFLGGGKVATSQLFFPDALNQFVYENVSPYTERAAGRDTVNATDGDAHDGGDAAFCYVKEEADRYLAGLVVGIDRLAALPARPRGPGGPPPGGPSPGGPPSSDEGAPSAPPAIDKAKLVPGAT
jgi:protocatechuate 3,4-dioxygenase beta subunit